LHNLEVAGIDPASIDAIALSHAHYDHTGGLGTLLGRTSRAVVYANRDLFRERFSRRGKEVKRIGPSMSERKLRQRADLRLSAAPQEILPGVFTTGEIVSRTEREGRSAHHVIRDGDGWTADPYRDDLSIVIRVAQGLVVLCGCCHAGLLNTLQHVRARFDGAIVTVLGGMHLAHATATQLAHIAEVLRGYDVARFYPNHCSGERAYVAMANAFGDRVAPLPSGTEVILKARYNACSGDP
jgi:7,8-dihydropterin-6-yl-methyl-4-(beta-D-ribofuranosyl)aminobenzene 5'-phosphate synthase